MAHKHSGLRYKMLLTTAAIAWAATPSIASAQLVTPGDLVNAVDHLGAPGQLTFTTTTATQATIDVNAQTVIADWVQFHVPVNTTLDLNNASTASEATLLNRVIGAGPSDISGTINTTDVNLWLINQDGIMFGSTASINANSFVASTLDVANLDFFEFGNNIDNTVNFAGVSTGAITNAGGSITTNGTLFFVSQDLDLTGTLDAQTGRAAFVAASDVDVQFNPGSPLGYTITSGTTVASQNVSGSVTGDAVDFQMVSAAGVVGALLQVDAAVTATTATPTDTGILLSASGLGADQPNVVTNGVFNSSGVIDMSVSGDYTANQALTGSAINLDIAGTATTQNLSATNGSLDLSGGAITALNLTATDDISVDSAGAISLASADAVDQLTIGAIAPPSSLTITGAAEGAGVTLTSVGTASLATVNSTSGATDIQSINGDITATSLSSTGGFTRATASNTIDVNSVSATGDDAILNAGQNVITTAITSSAAIDVDSTGGGALDLGNLNSGTTTDIDTTGAVMAGAATAGGVLTVGGVTPVASASFSGDVTASSVDIDAVGLIGLTNVSATAGTVELLGGSIDIDATSSLELGLVTTTAGDLNIATTSGDITTSVVSATGGDAILSAAGDVTTTSITSTAAIDVDSTGGGALDLGDLNAGTTIDLDTSGAPTATVTAGTTMAGGTLTVGGVAPVAAITFTGDITAGAVDLNSAGALSTQNITATIGNVDLEAASIDIDATMSLDFGNLTTTAGELNLNTTTGNISAAAVSATGGDAVLSAPGTITTDSIASTAAIDVDSTGGGALDLGNLSSGTTTDIDTTGAVMAGSAMAGGLLTVGGVTPVASAVFSGNISAGSVDINTAGMLTAQDIAATNGSVDIDSSAVMAQNLSATDDIFVDATGAILLASADAGNQLIIGGATMPSTLTVTGLSEGASVDVMSTGVMDLGAVNSTAGAIEITSAASNIIAGAVNAMGGNAVLTTPGTVTTTSITSTAAIDVESTNGGALDLGNLDAGTTIDLETSGMPNSTVTAGSAMAGGLLTVGGVSAVQSAEFTGNISAGAADINTIGMLTAKDIAATNGSVDIDSSAVTAVNLSATDNIFVDASGAIMLVSADADDQLIIGGMTLPTTLTVTGLSEGASVDVMSTGVMDLGAVNSTAGAIEITSTTSNIMAGAVNAMGGNAVLSAPGTVTTASIASTAAIDVDSTNGGALNLGNLNSGTTIDLDTSGMPSATVTAGSAIAGGLLTVGGATPVQSVNFTGDIDAAGVNIHSIGMVTAQDVDAISSSVLIEASAGSVSTGDVTSSGVGASVTLQAGGAASDVMAGAVTTNGGDLLLTAGNDIMSGAISTSLSGPATGGTAGLHAGGSVMSGAVNIGEDLLVQAGTTATIDGGRVGDDVNITASGDVTLTSALTADGAGPDIFEVGFLGAPGASSLVFAAETQPGSNVTLTSTTGAVNTQDVTTIGSGNIDLNAQTNVMTVGTLDAGGDVLVDATAGLIDLDGVISGANTILKANGDVTTTSIDATGLIDVDSMAGGALDLGNLDAGTTINLDTSGTPTATVKANTATAGGLLTVGGASPVQSAEFTGNINASAIDINTIGMLTAKDIEAINGSVDIDSGSVSADNVKASDDIFVDAAGTVVLASADAVDQLSIGAITKPSTLTITGLAEGAGVNLSSVGTAALNTVNSTAGQSLIASMNGDVTATSVMSNGGNNIITAGNNIAVTTVSSSGGDTVLNAAGGVMTSSISSSGGIDVDSTGGGALNLGTLNATSTIALDTAGTVTAGTTTAGGLLSVGANNLVASATFTGLVNAGSVDINSSGALNALNINANNGSIDIDSGSVNAGGLSASDDIFVDAAGSVVLAGADAVDQLIIGATTVPSTLTIIGAAEGAGVTLSSVGTAALSTVNSTSGPVIVQSANGDITATSVTSNGGNVDLMAGSNIAVTTVNSSGGDSLLSAGLNVATSSIDSSGLIDVDSTGGGMLDLGTLNATTTIDLDTSGNVLADMTTAGGLLSVGATTEVAEATFTGVINAGGVDINSSGALTALDINATNGSVDIDSGSVLTENVTATDDIFVDAAGSVIMASADAVDQLVVGATTTPSELTILGLAEGADVSLTSVGTATLNAVNSTAGTMAVNSIAGDIIASVVSSNGGDVDLMAGSNIDVTSISSMGGDSLLLAGGDVTTSDITSSAAIDVDSTGGGELDLGTLSAGSLIELDTSGSVTADATNAGGVLSVGANTLVASADFTGDVNAFGVDINASGPLTALDINATGGSVDIDTGSVNAGQITAADDILVDASGAVALSSANAVDQLIIGANTVPSTLSITGAAEGAGVDMTALGAVMLDSVNSTAGDLSVTSTMGAVTANTVTSNGGDATLSAGSDINAVNVSSNGGDSVLTAGGDINSDSVATTGGAAMLTAGNDINAMNVSSNGGDSVLTAGGDINTDSVATSGGAALLTAGNDINAMNVSSDGGDSVLTAAGNVTTMMIMSSAAIDVDSTGGGALNLGTLSSGTATNLDTSGAVMAGATMAGGPLLVGATTQVASAEFTDNVTAQSIDINAAGTLMATDMTATSGSIDIDSGSVMAANLTASDDIFVDAAGAVLLESAVASDQLAIGSVTPASQLSVTGLSEGATVELVSVGAATLGSVVSTAGAIDIVSTGDVVTVDSVSANGGDATLNAAGNITANSIGSTGAVNIDSASGGVVEIAVLDAGTSIDLDTSGDVIAGSTTAGTSVTVGATSSASSVMFTQGVNAAELDVTTSGLFTAEGAIDAGASSDISSGTINLTDGSSLAASQVLFRISSNGDVSIGDGTEGYVLDNAQLDRIVATDVLIDAGSNNITISGVAFSDSTGSDSFTVASSGDISLGGDITASGDAGRIFRYGGVATSATSDDYGLANRITANIDEANFDFGPTTVVLRGDDIAFGRESFIEEVEGLSSTDIAGDYVGNSSSALYNALLSGVISTTRAADPVYLRVGNLVVGYENSALFQNTASSTSGTSDTVGVIIGNVDRNGTLSLETTDNNNAFAMFGQINGLDGKSAALAGPNFVVIDDLLQVAFSRINGCQIGSGADCVTIEIGTTTVDVPRENVTLIETDNDLLVPFDPLVGTNNEGLFSDAAISAAPQDCLRNENGECVSGTGGQ